MEIGLFKKLAEKLITDMQTGKHSREAGWIEATGNELDKIREHNLIEYKNGHIRLFINEANLKKMLSHIRGDDLTIELLDICIDIARALTVEDWMESIAKELGGSTKIPAALSVLGWWRMLNTSSFPVVVDSIFEGGLNVVEWSTEVPEAAWDLSMDVVRKSWGINQETIFQVMKTLHIPLPDVRQVEISDKVRKILVWSEVAERFSKGEIEMLGFLWCVEYLLVRKEIQCPEALTFIQEEAWELLYERIGKSKPEFIERLDAIVEELGKLSCIDDVPTVGWKSIIRLPW